MRISSSLTETNVRKKVKNAISKPKYRQKQFLLLKVPSTIGFTSENLKFGVEGSSLNGGNSLFALGADESALRLEVCLGGRAAAG